MSAILAIAQGRRVHVMADAAFYDAEGRITSFEPKVIAIPGANAAFASRGSRPAPMAFSEACALFTFAGFDDFIRQFDAVHDVFLMINAKLEDNHAGLSINYEFVVGGWSEKHGCGMVLYFSNLDEKAGNASLPPGALYVMQGYIGGPDEAALPSDLEAFDPIRHGIPAFEIARNRLVPIHGPDRPEMGYAIGGFISHAVIDPGRVTIETVHEWPDKPGETIQPGRHLLMQAAA